MTPEMNLAEIFAIHNPLDKECLKEVEQAASLARVPKRSVLLRQGDVCRHFYFNRSGLMRVAHIDDGTEDTVCFGTSGDVFTSLQSYFDGSPSIFSLVSLYDSEVYSISYEDLDRLSSGFPALVLWMRNLLIEQVYAFERRYLFFGKSDAETRYRNFISQRNGLMRDVPVKYVAQYLKIAPEYLSRIRRRIVGK